LTDTVSVPATGASAAPEKPATKPARPHFSSGPCAKPPGWSPEKLATEVLGRSHRSKIGKARLQRAIDLTRELLQVPDTHRIGIVPGSDTGAVEMAMWSLLGARPVTLLAWESFGEGWVTDAVKQLKIEPTVLKAPYGEIVDLTQVSPDHDVIFTWNGTTSGVRVPNGDWIADDRGGLTIADATSAVFAMDLPWDKLDVVTFSWQKVLGGEGAHGVLILGPRAVERLESYTPAWPLPKIFRMTKGGKLIEGIFKGETINTPSMLAVEDAIFAMEWAQHVGGFNGLIARSTANATALGRIVEARDWLDHLPADPAIRSNTSVCLKLVTDADADAQAAMIKKMASLLEAEGAAFDIAGYREAPAGLRIWCGATVDTADIEALGPWLDWAWEQVKPA
jgi:phosphoserine aminotransferase